MAARLVHPVDFPGSSPVGLNPLYESFLLYSYACLVPDLVHHVRVHGAVVYPHLLVEEAEHLVGDLDLV